MDLGIGPSGLGDSAATATASSPEFDPVSQSGRWENIPDWGFYNGDGRYLRPGESTPVVWATGPINDHFGDEFAFDFAATYDGTDATGAIYLPAAGQYQIEAKIRVLPQSSALTPSGSVTVDMVGLDSQTQTLSDMLSLPDGGVFHFSRGFPVTETEGAGQAISFIVSNDTNWTVWIGTSQTEGVSWVELFNYGPSGVVTPVALCDEEFVAQGPANAVDGYVSSTGAFGTSYTTLGTAWAETFAADHSWYVAESIVGDTGASWAASTFQYMGDQIIADGKFFEVVGASPLGYGGTSGATEPTWPTSGTVIDNELTWQYIRDAIIGHNLIEKFDNTGTSLGAWGPLLTPLGVLPDNAMGIRVVGTDVWLLAYTGATTLKLFRISSVGTVTGTWTVARDQSPGAALSLDISTTGKAYYVEHGSGLLRIYDPGSSTQLADVNLAPAMDDPTHPHRLGGFFLTIGSSGLVISHAIYEAANIANDHPAGYRDWLEQYDHAAVRTARAPLGVGTESQISKAETSRKVWAGSTETGTLIKFDLNTLTHSTVITPSAYGYGLASCAADQGIGLEEATVGLRRPWAWFLG